MSCSSSWLAAISHLKDPQILGTVAALSLAYAAYHTWRQQEIERMQSQFACQSIELPGPERIHVNAKEPNLISIDDIPCKTIHEIFLKGIEISGDKPFLGRRPDEKSDFIWTTYNEIYAKAHYLGSALYELGYRKGSLIGICAANKQEWVIIDQGAMMFSMVLVPIYNTLGEQGIEFIMEETEVSIMFCDANNVKTLLQCSEKSNHLKTLVVFDPVDDKEIFWVCEERGIKYMTMDEILEFGKDNGGFPKRPKMPPSPEDLALICYTSGTTGNPKGVMLTHGSLAANTYTGYKYSLAGMVGPEDSALSYLPLSHMYERISQYICMLVGARVGFFRGDVKELIKDIQTLKPTVFASVPRLLNALYDKVMTEVSKSVIKSFIMKTALSFKTAEYNRGILRKDSFWDMLVFRKIQATLGGRVRLMVTGSAPLSSKVKNFLICAMGCPVFEGYGQTEICAIATTSEALDPNIGHVGPPVPFCRIKLADVPELDYFAKDGKGEVCIQGPNVFSGYYKNEEKTKETLDEEKWCHTGDIGTWLPNGTLAIIDRKKHIFKLSQGEYIAPEKIETIYLRSSLVAQVYVTGNSLKPCVVALVSPDPDNLMNWARSHHLSGSIEELCNNKVVNDAVLESVRKVGAAAGLNSLEQVKGVYLIAEQFSIENGLLTPTMKIKRRKVQDTYASEIDSIYEDLANSNQIKTSSFLK